MEISGIYKIQSKCKPERCYFGSSYDINHRWLRHLSDLRRGKHRSIKLQRHYNKYSKIDLVFSIVIGCSKEDLISTEQFFLDAYKPYFNTSLIAGRTEGVTAWNKGKKNIYSKEALLQMSLAKKGKPLSEEHKVNIRLSCKGINTGKMSDAARQKMRENSGRRGKPPWNKGLRKNEYFELNKIA